VPFPWSSYAPSGYATRWVVLAGGITTVVGLAEGTTIGTVAAGTVVGSR
jgi:hypothetical protein